MGDVAGCCRASAPLAESLTGQTIAPALQTVFSVRGEYWTFVGTRLYSCNHARQLS
jgi:hypothetical protein